MGNFEGTKSMSELQTNTKMTQIVEWFSGVCRGIRDEYEQGASYRKLNIDRQTLRYLLNQLVGITNKQ